MAGKDGRLKKEGGRNRLARALVERLYRAGHERQEDSFCSRLHVLLVLQLLVVYRVTRRSLPWLADRRRLRKLQSCDEPRAYGW